MERIETKKLDTDANGSILIGGEKPVTISGYTVSGKVIFAIYGVADVFPLTPEEARAMATLLNDAASQVEHE